MDRRDRERLAARQHHQDHRVDLDSRTPLAWQHRDFNYQVPHTSSFNERYPGKIHSRMYTFNSRLRGTFRSIYIYRKYL